MKDHNTIISLVGGPLCGNSLPVSIENDKLFEFLRTFKVESCT